MAGSLAYLYGYQLNEAAERAMMMGDFEGMLPWATAIAIRDGWPDFINVVESFMKNGGYRHFYHDGVRWLRAPRGAPAVTGP
jgi:hypothetical protein